MRNEDTGKLERAYEAAWGIFALCIGVMFFVPAAVAMVALVLLVADLVALLVIRRRMRLAGAGAERSVPFVAGAAIAWAMIGTLLLGQAVVGWLLGLFALLYFVPRAFGARKEPARMRVRLSKAAATLVAAVAAILVLNYEHSLAASRAQALIAAADQFNAKRGHYPRTLNELVPEFIVQVPVPSHVAMMGRFRYSSDGSRASLTYVVLPPYGRRSYSFETRRWRNWD